MWHSFTNYTCQRSQLLCSCLFIVWENRLVIWKGDQLPWQPGKGIVWLLGSSELVSMEGRWGTLARTCLLDGRLGQAERGGLLFAVSRFTNHECISVIEYLMNGGTAVVCIHNGRLSRSRLSDLQGFFPICLSACDIYQYKECPANAASSMNLLALLQR